MGQRFTDALANSAASLWALVAAEPAVLWGLGLLSFLVAGWLAHRQPGAAARTGGPAERSTLGLVLALGCLLVVPIGLLPGPVALYWVLAGSIVTGVLAGCLLRERAFGRAKDSAVAAVGEGVLIVDPRGRLLEASASARAMLWPGAAPGRELRLPEVLRALMRELAARQELLHLTDNRVLECSLGESSGPSAPRAIVLRDITGLRRDEHRLLRLAHYDSLTGLANRRLFIDQLDAALEAAKATELEVALFYIDLDRFKEINDTMGHAAGDQLLSEISQRFRTQLLGRKDSPTASVYRLGGDEFAILAQASDRDTARRLGAGILRVIGAPMELLDRSIQVSGSVGIAMFPSDGGEAEVLVRHADAALYVAKGKGRDRCVFYDPAMSVDADRARLLESELRGAIERAELTLHYQPKVDLATSTVSGFEALLRWYSRELGFVSPKDFIPVAEERGVIREIGAWCINEACQQIRAWQDAGYRAVPVSVNFSSAQFAGEGVIDVVTQALQRHEIDPRLFQIELTESLLLSDNEATLTELRDLRAIGVTVALDDFGTGYSALTYLNSFPLDVVKMDRGFLRDIETSRTAAGIVSAVISMGHSLGLRIVAEGVDGLWQLQLLEQMQCDEIQGFLYSPPIPSQEATRFLAVANGRAPTISPKESVLDVSDQFHWSEDEAPAPDRPAAREAHGESVLPHPVITRSKRVRVLVAGDSAELGAITVRLMRLGADVHFAQGMNEACLYVKQEGAQIDVLLISPEANLAAAAELVELAEKDFGTVPVTVVTGARPSGERQAAIRAGGVSLALWTPVGDGEIEYVLAAAAAQKQPPAQRRMLRVPMDSAAWIRAGNQTESAVLTSLSPKGAFAETSGSVEVGRPIRLEFELPTGRVRTFANVANVRPLEEGSSGGTGFGVVFYDLDAETEARIREAVDERCSRYRP